MPHGNCGEWDSGRDRTSVPLRVGDELWMYFAGMPAGCFYDPDADDPAALNPAPPSPDDNRLHREQRPWRVGLAKLRVDGWGYVQLKRGAPSGYLTTIPFEYQGGDLVVNGCGLGVGGIRVEVIHTDGQSVVEGFGKQPCAFDATDGVECRASWGNNTPLAPGMYRLRVVFEGLQARLYSFGFDRRPP
jgi:hypothetical protein